MSQSEDMKTYYTVLLVAYGRYFQPILLIPVLVQDLLNKDFDRMVGDVNAPAEPRDSVVDDDFP
jgi:hypothetical protein